MINNFIKIFLKILSSLFKNQEADLLVSPHVNKPKLKVEKNLKTEPGERSLLFIKGEPNLATSLITIKVRELIGDEFGGGINGWDLNCTEYTLFKLMSLGLKIEWPVKSGRHGGKWAGIFKNHGRYKVLDYPKINCAMSLRLLCHPMDM